jgi:Zn-dependent peptidase ImmA (M78 family)/transcriptional regulator with XRE-family HTH domain
MGAQVASSEVPFNPNVFAWARRRRRLTEEHVARRLGVPAKRIVAWEAGESSPTVVQARRLAHVYERPFLEFLSPTLPEIQPPRLAPDFRFHREPPSDVEEVMLESAHAWAEEQRLNALDLYDELGDAPPRFPEALHAFLDDAPDAVAARIRGAVGPPIIELQLGLKSADREKFPTILRRAFEAQGLLVLKQSGLGKARTRGICLYDAVLPVIVFGNESPGAQAFTLAHEFGHVVLGASAVSGAPRFTYARGPVGKRIEGWCNTFAAAFLMPADAVRAHPSAPRRLVENISDDQLNALATKFCVSRHAMLVRLVSLGLVDPWFYWRVKRPDFVKEESEYESFGRPKYYGSRFRNSLGDRYTGLVIEAVETGRIGFQSAAEFMGTMNVRHFLEIRNNFER